MKKLLFEASILGSFNEKSTKRSGIYVVTSDILDIFIKKSDYDITIYTNPENFINVKDYISKKYNNVAVVSEYQNNLENKLYFSILSLRKKKYNSFIKKIIKKILILSLSIIHNIFYLLSYHKKYKEFISFDIFFSTNNKAPDFILKNKKIKRFLIIHDFIALLFPEYKKYNKTWIKNVWSGINKNDYYFCISKYTKKDLLKNFPFVQNDHVCISYNGLSNKYNSDIKLSDYTVLEKYNISKNNYIFSLGNLLPHKNIKRQILSFIKLIKEEKIDNLYYVITGTANKLNSFINNLNIPQEFHKFIKFTGYLDDEEIKILFKNALFFSFTSLFEGFGLPVLEAMSLGCPVVSSNTTSLPEVCEDAALLINPEKIEEHVEAFKTLYYNEKIREELICKGNKQYKKFNWNSTYTIMKSFIDNKCNN